MENSLTPTTLAQAMDFKKGDNLGVPLIDNNPVIKNMMTDLFTHLELGQNKEEQLNSFSDIKVSFDENPDVKIILDSLRPQVLQLKFDVVYNETYKIMSEFINTSTLLLLLKTTIKEFYKSHPPELNADATRHSYSTYMLQELVGQCSYDELTEGMPLLEQFNKLLLDWNDTAIETNEILKKKGRKTTALEQSTCFKLREVLKLYNGKYTDDLICILKAFKDAFPELCENLPYLNGDGLKKAITRGSKFSNT